MEARNADGARTRANTSAAKRRPHGMNGPERVCPRCGTPAEAVWCPGCGLNLKQQGDLPTREAYQAKERERAWLEKEKQAREEQEWRERVASEERWRQEEAERAAQRAAQSRTPKPDASSGEPGSPKSNRLRRSGFWLAAALVGGLGLAVWLTVGRVETRDSDRPVVSTSAPDSAVPNGRDASPAASDSGFVMPSGNIGCRVDAQQLRCDILQTTAALQPPASCELDYGDAFVLGPTGRPRAICHGDTVFNEASRTLSYGMLSHNGPFTCESARRGLTCRNRDGHGWFLSRGSIQLF